MKKDTSPMRIGKVQKQTTSVEWEKEDEGDGARDEGREGPQVIEKGAEGWETAESQSKQMTEAKEMRLKRA